MASSEPPGKIAAVPCGRGDHGGVPPFRRRPRWGKGGDSGEWLLAPSAWLPAGVLLCALAMLAAGLAVVVSRVGGPTPLAAAAAPAAVPAAFPAPASPDLLPLPAPAGAPPLVPWDIIVAIAAMILVVAFLAASEAALAGVRKTRLRQLAEEGKRSARPALRLVEEPTRFLATIQIGITLATMFAAALAATVPTARLAAWLSGRQDVGWVHDHAFALSLVIVILVVGFVELLFGELIPKRLAVHYSERFALRVAGIIEALAVVSAPAVYVLTLLTNACAALVGGTETTAAGTLTEEEIKNIVEESEKEGILEEQETEMIHSVLEFTDIVVREVMVPRIDMVCVEVEHPVSDLVEVVLSSGHTRIPIYEETVDNIIGVVHAKDLLRAARDGVGDVPVRDAGLMRSVYYVPENMKVDDLLEEFQRTKNQLAIVVDEYGGTAGLVTLEDLLEEIVGEITDEYDVEHEPALSLIDDNVALVDARMSIDDVNEALDIHLPEEDSETLGGFVFGILGKIPTVGEVVNYDSLRIEVVEADSRRITRVKITRLPAAAEAGEEA